MSDFLSLISQRILDISNPEVDYTQEDFDNEFPTTSISVDNDSYKIKLKFVNKSNNSDPEYATDGASGFDLRAYLPETFTIKARNRAIIPTGLYFQIPENFEVQIRSRSGLAAKNGVVVLNSPGTIDADYTGEIKIILINHSDEDFIINNGDRIAQAVVTSVSSKNIIKLTKVEEIEPNTERGDGGFGSTGIA
jgi:dUTP pyrophosphatase